MVSVKACGYAAWVGGVMVGSFGEVGTEDLYHGRFTGRGRRFPPEFGNKALVKLYMLNAATALADPATTMDFILT
jgi:hypothetical protein